jgi:hypothetical protein
MTRCPHEGPHYRSVPKGQTGPWLCKDCLAQTEYEADPEIVKLAEILQEVMKPDAD